MSKTNRMGWMALWSIMAFLTAGGVPLAPGPADNPYRPVKGLSLLDGVYVVNDTFVMATVVQSCRIEEADAALLARQAKRRHLEVSTLSSLYLKEKALEEEFPGIGFRDSAAGREAYMLGHRVAVWEVIDILRELKTIAKTAEHFRWPPALVRCAAAFARAFPEDVDRQRQAETEA